MFRLIKTNPNNLKLSGFNKYIVAKGFTSKDEAIAARLELAKQGNANKIHGGKKWNIHIQEYTPRAQFK